MEEEFWTHRYIPVGSVITFPPPGREEEEGAPVNAALVEAKTEFRHGVKLITKYLGASSKDEKAAREKLVKNYGIHLCYPAGGLCQVPDLSGMHFLKPGSPWKFRCPLAERTAREAVVQGKDLYLQTSVLPSPELLGPRPAAPGGSEVEQRMEALKRKRQSALRVSFNGKVGSIPSGAAGSGVAVRGAGQPLPLPSSQPARALAAPSPVKAEPITVESSGDEIVKVKPKQTARSRSLGSALAQAASARASSGEKKPKKERKEKSPSKKKKKNKKDKSSPESAEEPDETSSSEDSFTPQKEAQEMSRVGLSPFWRTRR